MLEELGVTATFFVLGMSAKHSPDVVWELLEGTRSRATGSSTSGCTHRARRRSARTYEPRVS